jgi:hypothetical protein
MPIYFYFSGSSPKRVGKNQPVEAEKAKHRKWIDGFR